MKTNKKDLQFLNLDEIYFNVDEKEKTDDLKLVFTYAKLFQCLLNNELDADFIYELLPYKEAKIVNDYCKKVKQFYIDDIDAVKEQFK